MTPRDIQLITGNMSIRVAQKEHLSIREALGRDEKRLTIKEYCTHWGLDYDEICEFLNDNR